MKNLFRSILLMFVLVVAGCGGGGGSSSSGSSSSGGSSSGGSSSGSSSGGGSAVTAPSITVQPAPVGVIIGQTATFTVAASGTPTPTYQWQSSSDGGSTFADISGATAASYTTPSTALSDSGKPFRVLVSNSAGSVTSNSAVLTVGATPIAPVITTQPTNQSTIAPATATFTVVASGVPTPTYQWQLSTDGGVTFVNISGATSASYTTPATTSSDTNKRFQVIATDTAGSVTSSSATLTVITASAAGAGNGAAASCAPYSLPVGTTAQVVWVNSANSALDSTGTITNNGTVVFAATGQSATELVVNTTLGLASILAKAYVSFDSTTGVTIGYGAVTKLTNGNTIADGIVVVTPPIVDVTYSLSVGQSAPSQTETETQTTTATVNGVAGTPTTTTTTHSTDATTFVGYETITVPAGTFNTCRFLDSTTGVTKWVLRGNGIEVQDSTGGAATSITLNGAALTHN